MTDQPDASVRQGGGWCQPTDCGTGICSTTQEHDPGCPSPGWAYARMRDVDPSVLQPGGSGGWARPSEELYQVVDAQQGALWEFPALTVRRGGIRYPTHRVAFEVVARKRFLRPTRFDLHVWVERVGSGPHVKDMTLALTGFASRAEAVWAGENLALLNTHLYHLYA
jgi:hypothetical protein